MWGLNEIIHVKSWKGTGCIVSCDNMLVCDPGKRLKTPNVNRNNHLVFINAFAILPWAPIGLNIAELLKHNIELLSSINKVCLNESHVLPLLA